MKQKLAGGSKEPQEEVAENNFAGLQFWNSVELDQGKDLMLVSSPSNFECHVFCNFTA